jgi:hypothetical protein
MKPELAPGWNVFKQIFHDHWDEFKQFNPRYDHAYYDELVNKMLACGNPEQIGYLDYRCLDCGQGKHLVAMSCQSALCLRCAKVYVDEFVSHVSQRLHEGVIYRHTVLTLPAMLRDTFYSHSSTLLSELMRCGVRCMDEFFSDLSRQSLKGGYIVVLHTHGRNGQYNPHLHLIATSGGWNAQAERWVHLDYLPYELLNKKWQWHALTMLRQTRPTEAVRRLVSRCFRRYPKGFIAQVQDGDVPARYHSLATYLAKYVVTPPISVRRIDRYDGRRVTYHYRSHRTERVERETVDVHRFIGRMVQHGVPKGFKRVRYYGVQATKSFARLKPLIQAALARVQHVIKGAIKIIAPMTYRQRYHQSTGRDPLRCPHCQGEMTLWRIWHPKYGVIYDEAEAIKRGQYERRRERAPTERGHRHPLWATP